MSSPVGSSLVNFPSVEQNQTSVAHVRPTHLPFRRISLPSAPSVLNRQSIISVASFDSFPEEGSSHDVIPSAGKPRRSTRPSSFDVSKKSDRRKPLNDPKDAKRRRVINEFYETERSYVDGLELIYSHFLTQIIDSLDTPNQLLDRTELTSVFSNFIDIWNLHRSFFSSLSTHLQMLSSTSTHEPPPPLSPILKSHFPYLSLYNPFVSSFDTALSSYATLLSSKPDFASFIKKQEADPKCGKLKLRDWLLTVVQRCPRYLLLLKDLISCTNPENPEHAQLVSVHALVSKITLSLNTSLHVHAQTLSLLAIQRSTQNLPFQLISPGRSFLKRGPLLQVEGSTPREREFFLFSDCIMWLSNGDKIGSELLSDRWPLSGSPSRTSLIRTRSKSDAELSESKSHGPSSPFRSKSKSSLPSSPIKKQRQASGGSEEKWHYKGHIALIDVEVVVPPSLESEEQYRLELLSPQISFAAYAENEKERNEWVEAVRNAKESLFVSLNAMNPNSTLTSSSSTNHLRRTLQALPHPPEEANTRPKRGKVDHFLPAIWVPDSKTENCMRCGRSFGWRRRRHHCRLCGRCVCANCSGKTFFISDENGKAGRSHKPARACDACYEAVFPLMDVSPVEESGSDTHYSGVPTLSFPSWKSMRGSAFSNSEPALPAVPSFLMAIDLESPKRELTRIEDQDDDEDQDGTPQESSSSASPRIRIKPASRPRSYHQILEDFENKGSQGSKLGNNYPGDSAFGVDISGSLQTFSDLADSSDEVESPSSAGFSRRQLREVATSPPSSFNRGSPARRRKEDTARRQKRFSMPALGLQTTPVTARPNVTGEGKSQRFSLILGDKEPNGRASSGQVHLIGSKPAAGNKNRNDGYVQGAAAGKLSELLEKTQGR